MPQMSVKPERRHILDTSAIRGISQQKLRTISRKIPLTVSPYTALELLRHLSANEFTKYKAQLSKLKDIEILPFPGTDFLLSSDPESTRQDWTSVHESIRIIISHVIQATSYSQFCSQTFILGSSSKGLSLADFGGRLLVTLETLQSDYSEFIEECIKDVAGYDDESLKLLNEKLFVARVMEAMQPGFYALHKVAPGIDEDMYYDRFYLYFSFLMLKALRYAQKRRHATNIAIDTNDYVDAYLCLHLNLRSPCTLITEDKKLCEDLTWSLNAIEVALSYSPNCRVSGINHIVGISASA